MLKYDPEEEDDDDPPIAPTGQNNNATPQVAAPAISVPTT